MSPLLLTTASALARPHNSSGTGAGNSPPPPPGGSGGEDGGNEVVMELIEAVPLDAVAEESALGSPWMLGAYLFLAVLGLITATRTASASERRKKS